MKWTGLNEIREKYLSFFEGKTHTRLASAPLVPQGDNSLLLINSGMAPLKKYFLGQETPPNVRVTTCQKCIRTPDIERVGKTARHGTYFEMLGNFSFGDYFKEQAIQFAWEFLTGVLEIPAEKLWITVFENDDEAEEIWEKKIGIPHDRIVRLGKADNFWEHGSGPCGPCSEIHFDRGESYGPFENFEQASDCDRIIEIWNLVFSQFDSDGNGNYAEMASKNIDTGMGLERLACVMQDVGNLFEVDTVQSIMKHICEISGVEYKADEKSDVSLRVITDHIRSTVFMVGDGVRPTNEGRGYVLRRLLRRAARHGRLIGVTEPFLYKVCDTVIEENKNAYPELAEKREYIKQVIMHEEESFAKTIDKGMEILSQQMDTVISKGGKILSGEETFKLSDTFGFPLDLTIEIAAEKGLSVDEKRFHELMQEQKQKARSDRASKVGSSWSEDAMSGISVAKTEFTGYDHFDGKGKALAIFSDGKKVDSITEGDEGIIILDQTPFYAESGGQVGDKGTITIGESVFVVSDTKKTSAGQFLHVGMVDAGSIAAGDSVSAVVNKDERLATMRNHSCAHLLQAALREVLGDHVHQAGQLVNADRLRFDFAHFSAVSAEELAKV
ncbi:MAG: alanine--tRNA ligase, partial [Oscillospiraceae bacterium]